MKNILLLVLGVLVTLALGFLLGYRYGSPGYRLSPMANLESTVGPATFRLAYSRPYARNRVIFGEVVKYGRVWRTGANEQTEIEFDRPLRFAGATGPVDVPAGRYSLFTLPEESSWTLILNSQTGEWGTKYDSSLDVARLPMRSAISEHVEQMTLSVEAAEPSALLEEKPIGAETEGVIQVAWETTKASATFTVLP